jgi:hypothetical protein
MSRQTAERVGATHIAKQFAAAENIQPAGSCIIAKAT